MPEGGDEVHNASFGTDGWHCLLGFAAAIRSPQVAAWDDARRAIRVGVGVERDHYRGTEWRAWSGGLDVSVIVVEVLGFLAGVDDDGVECGEEIAGVEEIVVQGEDSREDGEFVEDAGFVEERVDAVCVVAFEVVSAGHGIWAGETVDFIARFGGLGGGELAGEDDVAVFEDVLDVGVEGGVVWEGF